MDCELSLNSKKELSDGTLDSSLQYLCLLFSDS